MHFNEDIMGILGYNSVYVPEPNTNGTDHRYINIDLSQAAKRWDLTGTHGDLGFQTANSAGFWTSPNTDGSTGGNPSWGLENVGATGKRSRKGTIEANQPLAGRHEESNPPTPSKKDRNIMKHIKFIWWNDEMPSKIRCKIGSAQFRTGWLFPYDFWLLSWLLTVVRCDRWGDPGGECMCFFSA